MPSYYLVSSAKSVSRREILELGIEYQIYQKRHSTRRAKAENNLEHEFISHFL